MLTKVQVVSQQGNVLDLPLQDISSGFLLKNIDGLDPVKATLISSPFANMDGEQYQTSRRDKRNLVIEIGIQPDYTSTDVQTLRSSLYGYFMPKSYLLFRFFIDDLPFVQIYGRVETCDATPFSKEPSMTVSVLCFDPDFRVPTSVVVSGSSVIDTTDKAIQYSGTIETGLLFTLAVNRNMSEIMLYNRTPGGTTSSMEFAAPLIAGDTLSINTSSGSKYARLTRGGLVTSVLFGINPSSTWLNLFPGTNQFRAVAIGAPIPYTIEYVAKYGGL